MFLFFVLYHFNALWKFLWLGNSVWDFLGLNLVQGFFWVLIFAPFDHPLIEIWNTPLGSPPHTFKRPKHVTKDDLGEQGMAQW